MRKLLLPAVLLSAIFTAGCDPTCNSTCKKLMSCSDVLDLGDMTRDDCDDYCTAQESLYEDQWTDEDLKEGFGDIKRCIKSEECDAIADGVCYDEDFYLW